MATELSEEDPQTPVLDLFSAHGLEMAATAAPVPAEGVLYGAVEAGGTKFVCGIGVAFDSLHCATIPTTTPDETLSGVIDFFRPYVDRLVAIGVASFGPINPNPSHPHYGYITTTPKPHWHMVDFIGTLRRGLGDNILFAFDTDVNAAALGEGRYGACKGLDTFVYVTVGTGVGGGAVVNGRAIRGFLHPEMGHAILNPFASTAPGVDVEAKTASATAEREATLATSAPSLTPSYPSVGHCPYHGATCVEGLVCGPALREAAGGVDPATLPDSHPVLQRAATVLGALLANITFFLTPQRIVLGGGVAQRAALLHAVRRETVRLIGGYVDVCGAAQLHPPTRVPRIPCTGGGPPMEGPPVGGEGGVGADVCAMDEALRACGVYVATPSLGSASGVCGAFAMAIDAAKGVAE